MQRAMVCSLLVLALLTSAPLTVEASKLSETLGGKANPIRKVVTLLQSMQKKVTEEGAKEKELYEKFMCYCKGGKGELEASVKSGEEKVPAVSSDIKATSGKLSQLKSALSE